MQVIGQDGPVVFLCHGSFAVKVNCNHLQKTDKTLSNNKYILNFHKMKNHLVKQITIQARVK